jgi:hypothetical protein
MISSKVLKNTSITWAVQKPGFLDVSLNFRRPDMIML